MYSIQTVLEQSPNSEILVYGIVNNSKIFFGKKGQILSFMLEDAFSEIKAVCFTEQFEKVRHLLLDDNIVILKCKYQLSEDWGPQLIVSDAYNIKSYIESDICPQSIIVPIDNRNQQNLLFNIINNNLGNDTEIIIFAKEKEYPPLKQKVFYSPKLISSLQNNFGTIRPIYR